MKKQYIKSRILIKKEGSYFEIKSNSFSAIQFIGDIKMDKIEQT